MASFHLCHTTPNYLHQTQANLPSPLISSSSTTTNITTPIKLHSTLSSQNTLTINHNVKHEEEPSISSSSPSTQTQPFPLRIGIIGLGEFGRFLAKAFQRQGHNVLGTSRSDYSQYCQENNIEFYQELEDMCESQPDVVLICSSILSTEEVVHKIPYHRLKQNTILADVLSVKQFPKKLLLEVVPEEFGILCTHPMFGRFSGKTSWEGLRFVYEKVRIPENHVQEQKCQQFLSIFQDEGCRMVEMSCEDHDYFAAESQFITHTIARILAEMQLESTPIDTKGYEQLVELTRNTTSHSQDLYEGLFLYNANATKQLKKLEDAFDTVKKNLFAKFRETLQKRIEEPAPVEKTSETSSFLPTIDDVKDLSSFSMVPKQGKQMQSQSKK